jgi:hypothetical protein
MNNVPRTDVINAIIAERTYQDLKWGTIEQKIHTIPNWLLIMKKELIEAEDAWMKNGDSDALLEILQVVATGFACLEQHGVVNRRHS